MTDQDTHGTLPTATRVGRVRLRVGDLARIRAFYRDVIGLSVQERTPDRAVLGTGETALLELVAAPEVPERDAAETGLFHVAFRVPDRAALGDALARIERDHQLTGASDHRVSEALYCADPEGNGVEVYRDRPRSRWPIADDGSIGIDTLALDVDAVRAAGTGQERLPAATTVGHVHLEVSALPAAERFYVDGLGFEMTARYGEEAVFLAAGGYHHHVGLNTWNDRTAPSTGRGLAHVELVVPTTAAFEAVRERLLARVPDRTERTSDDAARAVAVTDPDGIAFRVRHET